MAHSVAGPRPTKRTHRPSETVDKGLRKEKEKRATVAPEHASSSQKRKPDSEDKAKSRASDEFRLIKASLVLSIPPVFASDLRAGVEEMLDSMVMRYIPSLQGVLLTHSNMEFLSQTASIHGDCPFAVCNVCFDATVWGPQVSMKLVGRINLCSPDHISLLVHRTFNVSIPRHHIPQDQWSFEYGAAENDPEFGQGRDWEAGDESKVSGMEMNDSTSMKASGETRETENGGRWVHHLTGSRLGNPGGYLEFTVIGLTVANEMLSLQGSLQPDPFSPEHVPHRHKESPSPTFGREETSEMDTHYEHGEEKEEEGSDDDDDDGDDRFRHLAKLTDEAKATRKAKRAKEGVERLKGAKKRKWRAGRGVVDEEGPRRRKKKREKDHIL